MITKSIVVEGRVRLLMFSAGDIVRIVKVDEDEFTPQDKELIGGIRD